jgi:hypothetical protein
MGASGGEEECISPTVLRVSLWEGPYQTDKNLTTSAGLHIVVTRLVSTSFFNLSTFYEAVVSVRAMHAKHIANGDIF